MRLQKNLFNFALVSGLFLGAAQSASALELDCGIFELVGRYEPESKTLVVYDKEEVETRVKLRGNKVKGGFLKGSLLHYKVKIEVTAKITGTRGEANLLDVLGVANSDPESIPFRLLQEQKCK